MGNHAMACRLEAFLQFESSNRFMHPEIIISKSQKIKRD